MKLRERDWRIRQRFGEYLAEARQDYGMNLYDAGYVLGVTHQTVWMWEQGSTFPKSLRILQRLNVWLENRPCEELKRILGIRGIAMTKKERQWVSRRMEARHVWGQERKEKTMSMSEQEGGKWTITRRVREGLGL
jgi:transcriptional regulator with XRE-family HTH domain